MANPPHASVHPHSCASSDESPPPSPRSPPSPPGTCPWHSLQIGVNYHPNIVCPCKQTKAVTMFDETTAGALYNVSLAPSAPSATWYASCPHDRCLNRPAPHTPMRLVSSQHWQPQLWACNAASSVRLPFPSQATTAHGVRQHLLQRAVQCGTHGPLPCQHHPSTAVSNTAEGLTTHTGIHKPRVHNTSAAYVRNRRHDASMAPTPANAQPCHGDPVSPTAQTVSRSAHERQQAYPGPVSTATSTTGHVTGHPAWRNASAPAGDGPRRCADVRPPHQHSSTLQPIAATQAGPPMTSAG
jgi:hypothetical protein